MSFHVNVDVTNPGQFFACCGLFELAHRIWPGVEAAFDGATFKVECAGTLSQVLDALADCSVTNAMTVAQHTRFAELSEMPKAKRKPFEDEEKELASLMRESPIVFGPPLNLTVDWFHDDAAGGSRFKTWAGQQSVLTITKSMLANLQNQDWRDENALQHARRGCGVPFNFDSDLGGNGGALDIGFSFDALEGSALTRIAATARPALELLAFLGLQRFRPLEVPKANRFLYTAWNRLLPIQAAMPAACGLLPTPGSPRFEFKLLYRTKYLKSFLPAIPFTGASDE